MTTKRVDQYDTITPSGSEYLLIQNPATHPTAPLQYNKAIVSAVSGGAVTSVAGKTGAVSLTKSDVGLSNVDNTADASKPVSTAQAAADALKANISGQVFTGAISATNLSGTNTGDETTSTIKTKLGVTTLSGSNTGDQDLSGYATTTALTSGLGTKANTTHTHAESDITGLTGDLAAKQATLVSGTNIKTVNGNSLLGSGNLTLSSGGSSTLAGDTDVAITSPANKDLLTYDTASSKWTNQPAGSVSVPDATTTTKGIIELAGDLGGTAAAPTVPGLASKAPLAAPAFTGNATFDGTTLDIDSTNHRVGIGTAAPTSQLHMKGSAAGLTIENTAASSKSFMYLTDDVAGSNFFEFDVNGSGTGNTNLLSRPSSGLLRSGAGSTGGMLFVSQAAGAPIIFATGGFANGNERLRVDSNGIVTVSSAQGSATNTVVATDHTQTLTNKTISGSSNTLSNIPESAVTNLTTDLAAKSTALNPTGVKTAAYTVVANDFVPVDTTAGSVTLTLPTAPANGTRFGAKMVVQGGTNIVTINAGGTDVFNKTGGSTSVTLTLLLQSVQFQYNSGIWYGVAADIGVTALDNRYQAKLVSATNIKTVNGNSLLGSGDLVIASGGTGTVTSASVVSANGLAGTVATPSTTPAITLTTTVTGMIKGNGTALSAAVAGTDYVVPSGSITGTAAGITGKTTPTGALVGDTDTQTLTNKTVSTSTIASSTAITSKDSSFTLQNATTATKQAKFDASAITAATTRTLTIPDKNGTIATIADTIAVANGGTGATATTGSGSNVLATSPTLSTPILTGSASVATTPAAGSGTLFGVGTTTVRPHWINSSGTDETIQTSVNTFVPYKFAAYRSAAQAVVASTNTIIPFDTKEFDTSTNFTLGASANFVAPVAGFYFFSAGVGVSVTPTRLIILMFKNSVEFKRGNDIGSTAFTVNGAWFVQLAANDVIDFRYFCNVSGGTLAGQSLTYCSGHLVSTT